MESINWVLILSASVGRNKRSALRRMGPEGIEIGSGGNAAGKRVVRLVAMSNIGMLGFISLSPTYVDR